MKTEIQNHKGCPALFIDGQPHDGLLSSAPAAYAHNLLDAGFDIVDTHPQTSLGWTGPDAYDYAATDARIESYLSQSATVKLIVRFWLGYPEGKAHGGAFWWAAEHPEECVQPLSVEDGRVMPWDELGIGACWSQLIAANEGRPARARPPIHPLKPSFASLLFRAEAGEALRRVIAHLEEKYGDRIVGYVVGGGPCGEWFHWHADEARMMDYGEPMRHALPGPIPTPEQRFHPTHGNLRSAATERAVLEFYDAYHGAVRDTLLAWASQAKAGCQRQKVVMVFYGYLWNHNYGDAQARSGHAHLSAVLRSPDVDAIVAPFSYTYRQMDGVITGQSLAASVRRAGKLYLHELDGGTNLIPCWNSPDHHVPQTSVETGHLLRRELNKMLCEGSAGWYMDLRGGYFNSLELVAELRKTREQGARLRPETGRPNTEVVVVLDPRAPFHFREGEPLLTPLIDAFKQFELARMGLGFDDLTLDDLLKLRPEETSRYKFWIFPCAVHLTDEQQQAIRQHACRNGNHVLWNYAVNVCGRPELDLAGMERMTGFRCGVSLEPGELAVTVAAEKLVYGTYGDLSPDDIKLHAVLGLYATNERGFRISPRFFIEFGGESWGTINDLPGQPCGLAIRSMNDWVSVLSCAPLLPRQLLRKIARRAGCHVYTDFPAQVVHCENHVGLFFHADGLCQIALPHRSAMVMDVYSGAILGQNTSEVTFTAARNTTVLLKCLRRKRGSDYTDQNEGADAR